MSSNKLPRVAIYARVSTCEQSTALQIDEGAALAECDDLDGGEVLRFLLLAAAVVSPSTSGAGSRSMHTPQGDAGAAPPAR